MNRSVLFFFVISLAFTGLLFGFRMSAKAALTTIYVPTDYLTIQGAINAALNGDTIFVYNGTYFENIVVNKTVSLIGQSEENTIISAKNSSINALNVTSSNVNISGFSVTGATGIYPPACGLSLRQVSNVTFSYNNVTGNRYGIYMTSTHNSRISNNTVFSSFFGINMEAACQYNMITGNRIGSNAYYGIVMWSGSNNNTVANNTFTNNDRGIALGYSDYNIIASNDFLSNSMGVEIQQISDNNTVHNNNFIGNTVQVDGVHISDSVNMWDDGYPSGGNYWSDYNGTDLYSGPNQDVAGSDGMGDGPYVINSNNFDRYPLMTQYVIPEFGSVLPMLFFMALTLLAVIFHRKRNMLDAM
jgi:nitrous oxidase accessory protein